MCAQNAKLTQKYDIWIKIPKDNYLNTSKGTFYEDGEQKLNWFGLKCIKRSNLQQSSQDIMIPSNWKCKELIVIVGDT